VVSVQNLLRSQVIDPHAASGKVLMAAVQKAEDAYPKHILLSKLLSGMRFIKHGN
jgi:uracil phosphoribosyltransferase